MLFRCVHNTVVQPYSSSGCMPHCVRLGKRTRRLCLSLGPGRSGDPSDDRYCPCHIATRSCKCDARARARSQPWEFPPFVRGGFAQKWPSHPSARYQWQITLVALHVSHRMRQRQEALSAAATCERAPWISVSKLSLRIVVCILLLCPRRLRAECCTRSLARGGASARIA